MAISLQTVHAHSPTAGAKVLLVDDDLDLLEALLLSLRRAGFQPLAAATLPTALELFESERPDLTVLDVDLGRWSGLDLLTQLRRRTGMPILMLSGSEPGQVEARAIELGADDYLVKPITISHLIARIRAVLAQNRRACEQAEINVQLNAGLRDKLLAAAARDLRPTLSSIQHLAQRRRLRAAQTGMVLIDPMVQALEQIEEHALHMTQGLNQLLALTGLEVARRERVLVVEDDDTIRGTVVDLLNRDGYAADGAADGEQALAKLHAERADAIILDLRMPVMDGLTFVERYRQESDFVDVPIIVMSAAHDLAVTTERLFGLGVRVCLAKPFDVDALLALVARFIPHPVWAGSSGGSGIA